MEDLLRLVDTVRLRLSEIETQQAALAAHITRPDDCLILSPSPWNVVDRRRDEFLRKKQWTLVLLDLLQDPVLPDVCLD